MRIYTPFLALLTGLLLLLEMPGRLAAQTMPPKPGVFNMQGIDSATNQPIDIRLVGRSFKKGRQYTGTCSIKPAAGAGHTPKLLGEWVFTQKSDATMAGGARPAIAGSGTRLGTKPLRLGQRATTAGQAINFTIESQPDGRYQVLLMDAFSDESLEFKTSAPAGPGK